MRSPTSVTPRFTGISRISENFIDEIKKLERESRNRTECSKNCSDNNARKNGFNVVQRQYDRTQKLSMPLDARRPRCIAVAFESSLASCRHRRRLPMRQGIRVGGWPGELVAGISLYLRNCYRKECDRPAGTGIGRTRSALRNIGYDEVAARFRAGSTHARAFRSSNVCVMRIERGSFAAFFENLEGTIARLVTKRRRNISIFTTSTPASRNSKSTPDADRVVFARKSLQRRNHRVCT